MQGDIIKLKKKPAIISAAAVVGHREFEGPLGAYFDLHSDDDKFGMKTWEKAENEMQRHAVSFAAAKAKLQESNAADCIFAGDLMNQCTASAYALCGMDKPYFGLYGACSTAAEGLILSALMIEGGFYKRTMAVTSSHFCTAERQFRFPVEYGGQRTPTSQWTVTGAAAFILGETQSCMYVNEVLPGRVVDKGITDINNMGAAMAPAAFDTLRRYFTQSDKKPTDFDLIVTGDLGREGHGIVSDFLLADGIDMRGIYNDCGLMIFDIEEGDYHAGASGCGCSGVVLASFIRDKFLKGEYRDILFVGTGAMMSPMTTFQGESIPGIAHLVRISADRAIN